MSFRTYPSAPVAPDHGGGRDPVETRHRDVRDGLSRGEENYLRGPPETLRGKAARLLDVEPAVERVAHELRGRCDAESLHRFVLVTFDRSRREAEGGKVGEPCVCSRVVMLAGDTGELRT
jgi:hypothetical protein